MEILIYFFAVLSLLLAMLGIVNNKAWPLLVGVVMVFPFSSFLSNALDFSGFIFIPLFYLGSAAAVYWKNRSLAWLCLMPVILLAVFLLTIVFVFAKEGAV